MVGKSRIVLPEAPPTTVGAKTLLNENKEVAVANTQAAQPCSSIPPVLSRWAPVANNQVDRPITNEAILEDKHEAESVKSHPNNLVGTGTVIKPITPADCPSDSKKKTVPILAGLITFGFVFFWQINREPLAHSNEAVVSDDKTTDSLEDRGIGEKLVGLPVASPEGIANPSTAPATKGDGTFPANNTTIPAPHSTEKVAPPKNATPKSSPPKSEPKKPRFQDWLDLAEEGDVQAQSQVAHMYATGEGTKKDYEEAFRWNLIAAKRGSIRAQSNLGVSYGMGNGVERDNIEACAWWHIAARGGSAAARNNLNKYEKIFTERQMRQSLERASVLARQIRD